MQSIAEIKSYCSERVNNIMPEKKDILDAWIMVEHLSEGDVDLRRLSDIEDIDGEDYYTYFQNKMSDSLKGKLTKKCGFMIYAGVFRFKEIIDFLREKYCLERTEEDISDSNKFILSLFFDRALKPLPDLTFCTASGYIKFKKDVPDKKIFIEYEEEIKKKISEYFGLTDDEEQDEDEDEDDTDEEAKEEQLKKKFNEGFKKILEEFGISKNTCYIKVVKDIQSSKSELHSFFIDDLDAARELENDNLEAYLNGFGGERINLNSKKGSDGFNPDIFERILSPENYPLGRFPSNTKYALSFMQQVAVNLATGYDDRKIRSVNGPPGTGKTTLLKDIFAWHIVEQARMICSLDNKRIPVDDSFKDSAKIGSLPAEIAEKNIIVASSNNGAVQNIVNELPLESAVDEILLNELKEADYFYELSNLNIKKNKDKNDSENEYIEEPREEEKFWGLFSLEGGKSANMKRLLRYLDKAVEELNDHQSNKGIYKEFAEQYDDLKARREQVQRYSKNCTELGKKNNDYNYELSRREQELNTSVSGSKEKLKKLEADRAVLVEKLAVSKEQKQNAEMLLASLEQLQMNYYDNKPDETVAVEIKNAYFSKLNSIMSRYSEKLDECSSLAEKIMQLEQRKNELEIQIKHENGKIKSLMDEFSAFKAAYQEELSDLQKRKSADEKRSMADIKPLDMSVDYDELQLSNPWFDESYRISQSKLFITALKVRKQFLYENRKNVKFAGNIWKYQRQYADKRNKIADAWSWINFVIPVISSTFASFGRMCSELEANTMGSLFIDEAGQALPQAAVGAVFRAKNVMVVGDPSQIKPVLTLDSNVLGLLRQKFRLSEKYLSDKASTQTLVDAASKYGFFRSKDRDEESWIGIPLWVHRRCRYPMFTISNVISYGGMMVQGKPGYGKTGWYDIGGAAVDKYVEAQAEFLKNKLSQMIEEDPSIIDKNEKDKVYIITPFRNVSAKLAAKLNEIGFTRGSLKKPSNIGTIHTFQGKEAPIVFMVLGADTSSRGAAAWIFSEPNMMNVAATRAKDEFYIIGDKGLYRGLNSDIVDDTIDVLQEYRREHPELYCDNTGASGNENDELEEEPEDAEPIADETEPQTADTAEDARERTFGTVTRVFEGSESRYAYIDGDDGNNYTISEYVYSRTNEADVIIVNGSRISFILGEGRRYATYIQPEMISGTVNCVGMGRNSRYAYVEGDDGNNYTISENVYSRTNDADVIIVHGSRILFRFRIENGRRYITYIQRA